MVGVDGMFVTCGMQAPLSFCRVFMAVPEAIFRARQAQKSPIGEELRDEYADKITVAALARHYAGESRTSRAMNSESSKPIAGRIAEHSFWPTERQYAAQRDTMGLGNFWDLDLGRRRAMKLGDILTPERIKVPLVGETRREVIEELVDLLVGVGDLNDRDEVLAAIFSREQIRSTGIGSGLAIPHAKTSQVSDLIMAVGVCREPVDFDSIDDVGVRLVAMLISPEEMTPRHIRVLARVTGMMSFASVRGKLLEAQSADALYEVVCRYEASAA